MLCISHKAVFIGARELVPECCGKLKLEYFSRLRDKKPVDEKNGSLCGKHSKLCD